MKDYVFECWLMFGPMEKRRISAKSEEIATHIFEEVFPEHGLQSPKELKS